MSDSLKTQITDDMKSAMRAKAALRLSTIRMLIAEIKKREIDEKTTLDDTGVIKIINKMIKQRQDAIQQYRNANRTELADKEAEEITILEAYLPEQLSDAAVQAAVEKAIQTANATEMKDMGKVMGILKSELEGKTDMKKVSQLVRASLAG